MSGKLIIVMLSYVMAFSSCDSQNNQKVTLKKEATSSVAKAGKNKTAPQITFVELGSVNCIPCVKMQPVMKNIETKYEQQIEVIFYDVWKDNQKIKAKEYGIRLIPTQVFIDGSGQEIFRHEGFFPEEEIDQLLKSHGLIPKSQG